MKKILKKILKRYVRKKVNITKFKEIQFHLEKITLLGAKLKYPNSVVIKFGEEKIIGKYLFEF
jgi:hypothetical protein